MAAEKSISHETVLQPLRTFELIANPELKTYLEVLFKRVSHHEKFSIGQVQQIRFGDERIGIFPEPYHVATLRDALRRFNMIPATSEDVDGKRKTVLTTEAVLLLGCFTWKAKPMGYRIGAHPDDLAKDLLADLGKDPLASLIRLKGGLSVHEEYVSENEPEVSEDSEGEDDEEEIPEITKHPIQPVTPLSYISKAKEGIENTEARIWTPDVLDEKRRGIRKDIDTASFRAIPYDIARMLIVIAELNDGTLRNPDARADVLTNAELAGISKLTANYFKAYPKIKNLEELVNAIYRKYKAES